MTPAIISGWQLALPRSGHVPKELEQMTGNGINSPAAMVIVSGEWIQGCRPLLWGHQPTMRERGFLSSATNHWLTGSGFCTLCTAILALKSSKDDRSWSVAGN